MATINPFYRFENAIEVPGLSQGAYFISLAQESLYTDLNINYAGSTFNQVIEFANQFIEDYNTNYSTNFILEIPNFPSYQVSSDSVQIYIYNESIVNLYPLCKISLVFIIETDGVILSSYTSFLGPINEDYNYAPALFDGERLAYDSLRNQYETGAAIFPRFYQYDSTTGLAKSYIARFKDCKYFPSIASSFRFPVPANPFGNTPQIQFGQLDSDAKYIISLIESVIQYSMGVSITFNDIAIRLQELALPSGYSYEYFASTGGAHDRYQHNIYKVGGGQGFALILREDAGFLFQRFYTENFSSYNFLSFYSEFESLPYAPPDFTQRYGLVFYDYEYCVFAQCEYPAKESYPMPIKSGDNFIFNINKVASNTIGRGSVNIGLFDSNFNLVKKVGQASTEMAFCCQPYRAEYAGTFTAFDISWTQIQNACNAVFAEPATHRVGLVFGIPSEPTKYREFWFPLTEFLASNTALLDIFLGFNDFENTFEIESFIVPAGLYAKLTYLPLDFDCEDSALLDYKIAISTIDGTITESWDMQLFGGTTAIITNDLYANAIISSEKNHCYRFGLYDFGYSWDGIQSSWAAQAYTSGTNKFLAIVDPSNIAAFVIAIPTAINSWTELVTWFADNLPFMKVEVDGSQFLTITAYPYIDLSNYTLQIGSLNFSTGLITPITIDETAQVPPLYDTNINEVYAFSNLLEHNDADCFSTIIQFWNDSNSIAQGFEYYNDSFQQVRLGINGGGKKPIITDSLYRQSNGVHRRPQNKQDLSIDLHTDFIDFETQAALVDATRHQNFVVDGQNLFVNGDIEVATIQDFTTQSSFEDLAQVKFSALIQGYQPKNSSCLTC
jgi:hypothetical protein